MSKELDQDFVFLNRIISDNYIHFNKLVYTILLVDQQPSSVRHEHYQDILQALYTSEASIQSIKEMANKLFADEEDYGRTLSERQIQFLHHTVFMDVPYGGKADDKLIFHLLKETCSVYRSTRDDMASQFSDKLITVLSNTQKITTFFFDSNFHWKTSLTPTLKLLESTRELLLDLNEMYSKVCKAFYTYGRLAKRVELCKQLLKSPINLHLTNQQNISSKRVLTKITHQQYDKVMKDKGVTAKPQLFDNTTQLQFLEKRTIEPPPHQKVNVPDIPVRSKNQPKRKDSLEILKQKVNVKKKEKSVSPRRKVKVPDTPAPKKKSPVKHKKRLSRASEHFYDIIKSANVGHSQSQQRKHRLSRSGPELQISLQVPVKRKSEVTFNESPCTIGLSSTNVPPSPSSSLIIIPINSPGQQQRPLNVCRSIEPLNLPSVSARQKIDKIDSFIVQESLMQLQEIDLSEAWPEIPAITPQHKAKHIHGLQEEPLNVSTNIEPLNFASIGAQQEKIDKIDSVIVQDSLMQKEHVHGLQEQPLYVSRISTESLNFPSVSARQDKVDKIDSFIVQESSTQLQEIYPSDTWSEISAITQHQKAKHMQDVQEHPLNTISTELLDFSSVRALRHKIEKIDKIDRFTVHLSPMQKEHIHNQQKQPLNDSSISTEPLNFALISAAQNKIEKIDSSIVQETLMQKEHVHGLQEQPLYVSTINIEPLNYASVSAPQEKIDKIDSFIVQESSMQLQEILAIPKVKHKSHIHLNQIKTYPNIRRVSGDKQENSKKKLIGTPYYEISQDNADKKIKMEKNNSVTEYYQHRRENNNKYRAESPTKDSTWIKDNYISISIPSWQIDIDINLSPSCVIVNLVLIVIGFYLLQQYFNMQDNATSDHTLCGDMYAVWQHMWP